MHEKTQKPILEDKPDPLHVRGHSAKPAKIKPTLADWERYLELMARLVIHDPVYIPSSKELNRK
ncbi:hypothetical protein [Roseinatronobacter sp.]|uniref:hypothetical protein n=1 Tax=Roseinatronobacter sp. TaxID=1945755 RepID=UPI0025F8DAA3|nr:hypothetical protein [Roseibaca sp.]